MSDFPSKRFEGTLYKFEHLRSIKMDVPLNADGTNVVPLTVNFGCHCFTEKFDEAIHRPDHKYTYRGEVRAFDALRHQCSLLLPDLLLRMQKGKIYNADESFTYAAHIEIQSLPGPQTYSIFFSLQKDKSSKTPALKMFVKSAYLKGLVAKQNAQSWRFVSLAGEIAGAFPSREKKKPKHKKKKTPQGLISAA